MFDNLFSDCAFFFFFKWRLARAYQFHYLDQDQSTVAQRAETIVIECSKTSYVRARFLIDSHTLPGQRSAAQSAYSDFDG